MQTASKEDNLHEMPNLFSGKYQEILPICCLLNLRTECWPLSCWTRIYPAFANSVDPDQLASEEANWSGFALFVIKYVNL